MLLQVELGELIDGCDDRFLIGIILLTNLTMRILQSLLTPVVRKTRRSVLAVVLLCLHLCSRANLGDRGAAHLLNDLDTCRGKGHLGTRAGGVDSCDLHDAHDPYFRERKDSFS